MRALIVSLFLAATVSQFFAAAAEAQAVCQVTSLRENHNREATATIAYTGYTYFCTSIGRGSAVKSSKIYYRCIVNGKEAGTLQIKFKSSDDRSPVSSTLYPAGSWLGVSCE